MKIHRYFKYLAILALFTVGHAKSASLIFSQTPTVSDLACGGASSGSPLAYRTLSYEVKNTTLSTLHIGQPQIIVNSSDNATDASAIASITTGAGCSLTNPSSPYPYTISPSSTCTINVAIIPSVPSCAPGVNQTIDRTLYIAINTTQQSLSSSIQANITLLGTGADFAVLGDGLSNNDTYYGATNILGNLGYLASTSGTFYVSAGNAYTSTDSLAQYAKSDFDTAYTQLLNEPCQSIKLGGNALKGPINAGIYCLENNAATINIGNTTTPTPITLSGSGYFIFIVKTAACNSEDCAINVSPGTTFSYVNASPENVFWVLEASDTELTVSNEATFDGTILTSGTVALQTTTEEFLPSLVRGRIYSSNATTTFPISFEGNTVSLPKYILP